MSRWTHQISALLLLNAAALAEDWPNFLGPRHDATSLETGLKTEWKSPIPQLWEHKLGSGFSSFACVGDRLYTAGTLEGRQTVYCLAAADGKVIWQHPFEDAYQESMGGDGPRATPTVSDGRVYMLGAKGSLICLNAESGKPIWSKQYKHVPTWGYSGSVLVEGDLAISSGGKDHGALVAYNKVTGDEVWKAGDDPPGYATPYPFDFEGTRYVVGFCGKSVIVAELKTGKLVWRQPWETDYDVNAAAPIFSNGHLFLTSGYKTGCALFKLDKAGDKLTGKEVWRSKVLLNKFQSCVLHGGNLYASDQKALVCVEFQTGKELWRVPRVKDGTLLLADGHLFLLTESGQLQIARPDPKGWSPITSIDLLEDRCWTIPVIHNGRLYARNLDRMICLNLKAAGPS